MTNWAPPERGSSSIISVALVPAPTNDTPFNVSVWLQLLVPAGNCTVSPTDAEATALLTSVNWQLAALMILAWPAWFDKNKTATADKIEAALRNLEILAFMMTSYPASPLVPLAWPIIQLTL